MHFSSFAASKNALISPAPWARRVLNETPWLHQKASGLRTGGFLFLRKNPRFLLPDNAGKFESHGDSNLFLFAEEMFIGQHGLM